MEKVKNFEFTQGRPLFKYSLLIFTFTFALIADKNYQLQSSALDQEQKLAVSPSFNDEKQVIQEVELNQTSVSSVVLSVSPDSDNQQNNKLEDTNEENESSSEELTNQAPDK